MWDKLKLNFASSTEGQYSISVQSFLLFLHNAKGFLKEKDLILILGHYHILFHCYHHPRLIRLAVFSLLSFLIAPAPYFLGKGF